MATVQLDIKDMAQQCTLEARLVGSKQWKWRLKLAGWLIRLAAWVVWMNADVEIEAD